jgi:hypothetical protein
LVWLRSGGVEGAAGEGGEEAGWVGEQAAGLFLFALEGERGGEVGLEGVGVEDGGCVVVGVGVVGGAVVGVVVAEEV